MQKGKMIVTVTNDLNQDQRMQRICNTLQNDGYDITLTGRLKKNSPPNVLQPFQQKRLSCIFQKGFLFYAEYNLRLFFYLIGQKTDVMYSVDVDTLLAVGLAAKVKNKKFIFDAHEYFTETPELSGRKVVKRVWNLIAYSFIPKASIAITVNESLAKLFTEKYNKNFISVYNVPILRNQIATARPARFTLLYQGVLNKGRGLEMIIEAMEHLPDVHLVIAGEGDLSDFLKNKAKISAAKQRIDFTGWVFGEELKKLTGAASVGLNLLSNTSESYYYSLANKFFDYMHAGIPAIHMDFPEYQKILLEKKVGLTIKSLDMNEFINVVLSLANDELLYESIRQNCLSAREVYHWAKEEKKLTEALSILS